MPDHAEDVGTLRPNGMSTGAGSTRTEDGRTDGFTIEALAREFGVTLRTLRFYEARGLLSPTKDETRRIYSAGDRASLVRILKGKQLGFTLTEIRELLEAGERNADRIADELIDVGGLLLTRVQINAQLKLLHERHREAGEAIAEFEAMIGGAQA